MKKPEILRTERLIIMELDLADADFIFQLLNSPGWLAYIGDRNIRSVEDARQYLLKGPLKSYKENGFGLYLVQLKETGNPLGIAGLLKRDYLKYPDMGFAFLPEHEGRGFAFESTKAIVDHSRDVLKIECLQAIVLPENHRSIRLLEKLEMKDKGMHLFSGQDNPLKLFQRDFL